MTAIGEAGATCDGRAAGAGTAGGPATAAGVAAARAADAAGSAVDVSLALAPLSTAVDSLNAQHAALETSLALRPNFDHERWRRASIVTVAALVANAALRREESRGGHFRNDFPARDDLNWKAHISDQIHHR